MELVELGALSLQDWVSLTGREPEPFGSVTASLTWRVRDRHVGLRDDDGALVAAIGATLATIEAAGGERFEVVGIGSLIVRRDLRGMHVMTPLADALRRLAQTMGPERAMIFCREELIPLYRHRGYERIEAPVWADQPAERIQMPLPAMWSQLHPGPGLPPGRLDVVGLPF